MQGCYHSVYFQFVEKRDFVGVWIVQIKAVCSEVVHVGDNLALGFRSLPENFVSNSSLACSHVFDLHANLEFSCSSLLSRSYVDATVAESCESHSRSCIRI